MEHVLSLEEINCNRNVLTLLTLPVKLVRLDACGNKLSNLYAIEHCHQLEEVLMAGNLLYDLKLIFRNINSTQGGYSNLGVLDCSHNKIQHI